MAHMGNIDCRTADPLSAQASFGHLDPKEFLCATTSDPNSNFNPFRTLRA